MTSVERQDSAASRIGRAEALLYFVLPVVIVTVTGVKQLPGVIAGGLVNPDTYMRLVRLEAELQQHEIAFFVSRDASGAGTLLHWSHLLDSLLCLLAAPFSLVLDQHAALHLAASLFGPISMGLLGLALAWAALPLADRRWLWLAPVAGALSIPIASYGLPGVAHHHVLVVLVAVMMGGWALRAIRGQVSASAGCALGAWAGLGIWLSAETMPFDLMAFGALWLAWLVSPERNDLALFIRWTAVAFLLVIGCALAVDPPYAGYGSIELDRISIVDLTLALLAFIAGCAAGVIDRGRLGPRARPIIGLAIPVLCFIGWIALFPAVISGPSGLVPGADGHLLIDVIAEMQPVRTFSAAIQFLLTGSVATLMLLWLALRRRSLLIAYTALCALALVGLGAMHVRFAAYPAAAGAVCLPVLVTAASASLANRSELIRIAVRLAVIVPLLLSLRAGIAPDLISTARASNDPLRPDCRVSEIGRLLAPYAGQVVLADIDKTPELLYRTELRTVGSLYHRNLPAFLRLRAAWRSLPSVSTPDAVRQTGASLVLVCPSAGRSPLVADLPPNTLSDQLSRGECPAWLQMVAQDKASGNVLYRVIQ